MFIIRDTFISSCACVGFVTVCNSCIQGNCLFKIDSVVNSGGNVFPVVVTAGHYLAVNNRLRWSRGSVLAFSTQVCGFKPGRSRRIFRAKKSSARLPSERK